MEISSRPGAISPSDHGVVVLTALFVVFVATDALAVRHYDRTRPPRPKKIHMLVYGDGVWYYSFTRSILFDRDLDTTNEARYYWHVESAVEAWRAPTGKLNNYCPIGSSILWIPFVLLVHLFVQGDGLSFAYPAAAAFGSALLAWISLVLVYRRFRELAVVVALWFGSNLGYYMSVEALTSHACSFFAVTVLALAALDPGESPKRWVGLGLLLGLATLVRPEHALLGLILLPRWRALLVALPVAAMVFVPQILVWKQVSGAWLSPVAGNAGLVPLHAHETLFSTRHGLFLWHPVFLLGVLGLLAPGPRRLRIVAACVLLGAALFYGTRSFWWGGHSFGNRYFVGLGFFFAIGLANGASWLRAKCGRAWPVWGLTSLLLLWNASLLLLYVSRTIPQADCVPLSELLFAPVYAANLF